MFRTEHPLIFPVHDRVQAFDRHREVVQAEYGPRRHPQRSSLIAVVKATLIRTGTVSPGSKFLRGQPLRHGKWALDGGRTKCSSSDRYRTTIGIQWVA